MPLTPCWMLRVVIPPGVRVGEVNDTRCVDTPIIQALEV